MKYFLKIQQVDVAKSKISNVSEKTKNSGVVRLNKYRALQKQSVILVAQKA